jgi:hypothetical protein
MVTKHMKAPPPGLIRKFSPTPRPLFSAVLLNDCLDYVGDAAGFFDGGFLLD